VELSADHALNVVLIHPQIAPNTGNIGRLCVAIGARLHLVRPLGFVLSDKQLRRSVMDYWPRLQLTVYDDVDAFLEHLSRQNAKVWLFSSKAQTSFWEAAYAPDDYLVFGSENSGLPAEVAARFPERLLRIPQIAGERCLNLSTAAGIGVFEALRQLRRGV
jgi:tRNA (cytidine/uridine-2'-O-)-methyltransferase